jgi:hypothetical protein
MAAKAEANLPGPLEIGWRCQVKGYRESVKRGARETGLALFLIEGAVGGVEELLDFLAIIREDGDADADGETRRFGFLGHACGDATSHPEGGIAVRFRQYDSKLVAAEPGGRVHFAAMEAEDSSHMT